MAKKEGSPDLGHASAFDPAEFAAMTKKRIEDFVNAQSEVLGKFQETNREWLDRLQSEATLTFRTCFQIDGSTFDPGRDDGVSELDQSAARNDGGRRQARSR